MKTRFILFAGAILLSLMVSATDFAWWQMYGDGGPPIHAVTTGDQDYYLFRARATLAEGRPIASPFYAEHADGPARFALFEWPLAVFGRVIPAVRDANPVILQNLLRILSVVLIYLALARILRSWAGAGKVVSASIALLTLLWHEPFVMQEFYALETWFVPFHLFGLIAAFEGMTRAGWKRFAWLSTATISFASHPMAFVVGVGGIGAALAVEFLEAKRMKPLFDALPWGAFSIAALMLFFGPFLFQDSQVVSETMGRAPVIASRLPSFPLTALCLAFMAAAGWAFYGQASAGRKKTAWLLFSAFSAVSAAGMTANIVTGSHFLNDHYSFLVAYLTVIGGTMAWFEAREGNIRPQKTLGWFAASSTAIVVGALVVSSPLRSILVRGQSVPFLAGGVILGIALVFPGFFRKLKPAPAALAVLIAMSLAYPAIFLWRLNRADAETQQAAYAVRPAIEAASKLEPGVLMARSKLSDIIAMNTPHRPYWAHKAFIDEATNQELFDRWQDTLTFIPANASEERADAIKTGIFGLGESLCGNFFDKFAYRPLVRRGVIDAPLCTPILPGDELTAFLGDSLASAQPPATWTPRYELDYLLLDRETDPPIPEEAKDRFEAVWEDERFALYRVRPH